MAKRKSVVHGDVVILDTLNFGWSTTTIWDGPFGSNVTFRGTLEKGEFAIVVDVKDHFVEIVTPKGVRGWVQWRRVARV